MTVSSPSRRLQVIAVAFAVAALAMAAVAIAVVMTRSSTPDTETTTRTAPEPHGPTVVESRVDAADIVKLDDSTRNKLWSTTSGGIRIDDAALRKSFGLEADDVIVSIAGHELRSTDRDLHRAMFDLTMSLSTPTVVDVDVTRRSGPVLMRWRVSGDLRTAARDFRLSGMPSYGGLGSGTLGPGVGSGGLGSGSASDPFGTLSVDPPDPVLATITKIDDTHFEIPASTRDKLFGDPMTYMTRARVVPAVKNGRPDGFKLYAIRPASVFAALGFNNGDTVRAVNGYELTSADAVDAYTKLKSATSMVFDITRRGREMTISIAVK